MLPQNFRLSLLYRLGLPLYSSDSIRCSACGDEADQLGDHAIVCATENERICRHDALRDAIFEQARHAGLFPKREQRVSQDSGRRPGDIYIPSWRNRPHAFDVAVTSPLCASNRCQSSLATGAAILGRRVMQSGLDLA